MASAHDMKEARTGKTKSNCLRPAMWEEVAQNVGEADLRGSVALC